MGRRLGPRMKLSRRFGVPLFGTAKEAKILGRRGYPPGQHGPSAHSRLSGYGLQLREKQKAKITYGLLERQFHKYFTEAFAQTGDTGELLLQLLERRLDNILYRLGFAMTRAQARQIVNHGHIAVNGRVVDIPSYRVDIADVVTIRPQSRAKGIFSTLEKTLENQKAPAWLELDPTKPGGKVLSLPTIKEVDHSIDPQLIVEFYSR